MQGTELGKNVINSRGNEESVTFREIGSTSSQKGVQAFNGGVGSGQESNRYLAEERMLGGGKQSAHQTTERRNSSSSNSTASTSSRILSTASSSSIPRSSLSSGSPSSSLKSASIPSNSNPSSASSSTFPHRPPNGSAAPRPTPPMSVLYPPNVPLSAFPTPQLPPSSSSSHLRVQSHQSSTATPQNQTLANNIRPRTSSAPQPHSASVLQQIPPFNRTAARARQIPDLNLNSATSTPTASQARVNTAQASTAGRSALFTVTKAMRDGDRDLLVEVRHRIRELAAVGALKIESDLEKITLRRLTEFRLPTNSTALPQLIPHMKHLLMPGIAAQDYLYTFQLWHAYTLKSQLVTFPICGPAVAAFLITETKLADGHRPKMVWILEQYRKATIAAFSDLSKDPDWRKKMERGWGDVEWLEWERFVELSRIKLGDWKVIEELAPPAPPPSAARSSAPSIPSVASTSASTVNLPSTFLPQRPSVSTNSSDKALGKRKAVEDDVQQPPSARPAPSLGLNRYGQPRQVAYHKRKLPPLEHQADEEFYGAVDECEAAIVALRETRQKMQELANTTISDPEPVPQLPPEPSPRIYSPTPPPAPPPPPPFSDYTPSLLPAFPSEPILTDSSPDPLFALLSSLPSTPASFRLTRFPLGPDPHPLVLGPNGLLPNPSASYPHFTLTPHHFLSYPKCLTLPSHLSQKDQDRTFRFATDMDGHPQMVQLEKRMMGEGVGGDEREKRKKEELEKIVKIAIAESKPMEFLGGFEPREPEAAKRAWDRARRHGIEPVYGLSRLHVGSTEGNGQEDREKSAPKVVERSKAVEAVQVKDKEVEVQSAKKVGEDSATVGDRKGKRKAADDASVRSEEIQPEEGDERQGKSKKIRQLSNSETPSASPPSESALTRSAPIPVVSISTPDSAPSPSIQTSSLEPTSLQPQRPSLPPVSASAPAVPQFQQRSRSKSISQEPVPKMRRRPSITGPGSGVHPLALLYASQSPQFRQGARLKAAEIVAATKNGTIPVAKSPLIAAKVLTEGAVLPKASPRISSNGSSKLAKSPRIVSKPLSPPLVPIPLAQEGEVKARNGEEGSRKEDAMDIDGKDGSTEEGEFERLHPPSISSQGSSALGVILELPSPQPQSATTPASHASPQPESASAPDSIPPIPIPDSSAHPSPTHSTSSASLPSQTDTSAAPPLNASKFSRFVGRLSSGFGLFAGGSNPASEPALPTPTASPVTDRTVAPSNTEAHPESPRIAESPTPEEISRAADDLEMEIDELDESVPESIEDVPTKAIEERLPSPIEPEKTHSPATIDSNGISKGKGKEKEKEVEVISLSSSTAPSLVAASSPVPSSSSSSSDSSSEPDVPLASLRQSSNPKKNTQPKHPRTRPVIKSKDKGKGKAIISVEGKNLVLKDHPLRHVSKTVLAASDPIFPFGRSY